MKQMNDRQKIMREKEIDILRVLIPPKSSFSILCIVVGFAMRFLLSVGGRPLGKERAAKALPWCPLHTVRQRELHL